MKSMIVEEMKVMSDVYTQLRAALVNSDISMTEIGKRLGISKAGVSHYFNQRRSNLQTLSNIAFVLNKRVKITLEDI